MRSRSPSPLLAGVALLFALAIACRPGVQTTVPADKTFFPLELGQHWVYDTRMNGPTQSSTTTTTAVCRVRPDDDGDLLHLIVTCADDELVQGQLVYQLGDEIIEPVVFNSQGDARQRTPPAVLARVQLGVGQQWRWVGQGEDATRTDLYRVANQGRVLTPAGEFDAVRILVTQQGTGAPMASVERWYAPGVGLVKEAGAVVFPVEGQLTQIELVRVLKERGILPVEQISCCQKVPSGS